jgi:hypothetical protein
MICLSQFRLHRSTDAARSVEHAAIFEPIRGQMQMTVLDDDRHCSYSKFFIQNACHLGDPGFASKINVS